MVFVVGVAAAFCLALGYVWQQRVAARSAESSANSFRLLLELMHYKMWWGGIGAMVVGQLLGGLALGLATVALVEPLTSSSLLFAFVISAFLSSQRVRWHEVLGALLVSAALGVFIAVGDPQQSAQHSRHSHVVVLAVCVVAGVVASLVVASHRAGLVRRSILLATGAGLLYGLQDVSTRATLLEVDRHGVAWIFVHFWVYIVIAAGVVGIAISQSAFNAARLDFSLPPIAAAQPIAGIGLGIALLGDTVSTSPGALTAQCLSLAAMLVGVVFIGRSRTFADVGGDAVPTPIEVERAARGKLTEVANRARHVVEARPVRARPRSDNVS